VAGDDETPQDEQAPDVEAAEEQPAEAEPEAAPDEATEVAAAPAEEPVAEADEEAPAAEAEAEAPAAEAEAPAAEAESEGEEDEEDEEPTPRVRPEIPGADLEVDIVREGDDPLGREGGEWGEEEERPAGESAEEAGDQPIAEAAIDLGASARYTATGKRKTAIARVILKPGNGTYTINGKPMDVFFPRATLLRNIRQPLEAVGYDDRMDVIARMNGGGVSAQAGALRHGISRALIEADPNLRGELKRRGFLTRDARAKERKKAGLKKARKRPQFSKR
jgi:small subunit ribosomal protein S9